MTREDALTIVLHEGIDDDGMVTETRCGILPSAERMSLLIKALQVTELAVRGDDVLNRQLAFAIYSLAFHMSASIGNMLAWPWPEQWDVIQELIESIFDVTFNN